MSPGLATAKKEQSASAQDSGPVDISRVVKYAPAQLIGREDETKLLNDAWMKVRKAESRRPHLLTFVALGGEGKTSLVAKWAAELAHQDWPGCDAAFAWSFYSQGTREQLAASSDLFLKEALTFFGDDEDKQFAASNAGTYEKGQRLARVVGQRRALLILDGLEPLQYGPTSPTAGELKDGGLAALLRGLATTSHGLCIATTRYSIADLKAFKDKTVLEKELKRLSRQAGVNLLQSLGVSGNLLRNISCNDGQEFVNEYEKLVEDVKGHALTLNLLGTYLRDAHAGDIRKRDLVRLSEADAEEQGGHAFRVMEAYERAFEGEGDKGKRALAILRLLGLFDRPMTSDCLAALLQEPAIPNLTELLMGLTDAPFNIALSRLQSSKLITVNRDAGGALVSLDAHPLLREYFGKQLRENNQEAWRAAHRRLYEHLCATTKEGDHPTLEDLQPLYQAVAHGCQAGLQQEACDKVYRDRIQRGGEAYSANKLGGFGSDLGAIACFFETPWSRVSPALIEPAQAWLLGEAATRLRALGRLNEALEPMRAGLPMSIRQKTWKTAAVKASNLSELELTLGEVAGALEDASRSVTYADRSGDWAQRMTKRTTHADALHQAGRRAEAAVRFREAEQMQAEGQAEYPLLYSVQGVQYYDVLLTEAERAAWQTILECGDLSPLFSFDELPPGEARQVAQGESGDKSPHSKAPSPLRSAGALQSCRAVSERAAQTIKIAERNNWLLDIALDHLTLGRAALYAAILENSDLRPLTSDLSHIDSAVDGLRRSGNMDELPRGLLTRAWLRYLKGQQIGTEIAQSDLDEAWEIAEHGPMRLFMADIHLYRARLFHGVKPYPWNSPQEDLAAARKLIEQCGYWRRKEELQDAEAAAKNW